MAKDKGPPVLKFPADRIDKWVKVPAREPMPRPKRPAKPRGPAKPKCRCGCGKAAQWPLYGDGLGPPMFYTRKCGYLLALKMLAPKLAK